SRRNEDFLGADWTELAAGVTGFPSVASGTAKPQSTSVTTSSFPGAGDSHAGTISAQRLHIRGTGGGGRRCISGGRAAGAGGALRPRGRQSGGMPEQSQVYRAGSAHLPRRLQLLSSRLGHTRDRWACHAGQRLGGESAAVH